MSGMLQTCPMRSPRVCRKSRSLGSCTRRVATSQIRWCPRSPQARAERSTTLSTNRVARSRYPESLASLIAAVLLMISVDFSRMPKSHLRTHHVRQIIPGAVAESREPNDVVGNLFENIRKVILGKDEQIRQVLCAWLAGGHVLLEDF